MLRYLIYSLLLLATASCVSNKKVTLVQMDDVNLNSMNRDKVVRTYAVDTFEYRIQPNDIVSVKFESISNKEYDFFSSHSTHVPAGGQIQQGAALLMGELVDENGEIPIPLIGKFKIQGLTIFEAQQKLQAIAIQYGIEAPIARVRLLNYRVTILGEVEREETILLTTNRVSILEAIGMAGGLSELADRSKVKLIRQYGNQTEVVYINLLDESLFTSPYYYVHQNDILIVPALKQRVFRNYFGENLALFVSALSVILLTFNLMNN